MMFDVANWSSVATSIVYPVAPSTPDHVNCTSPFTTRVDRFSGATSATVVAAVADAANVAALPTRTREAATMAAAVLRRITMPPGTLGTWFDGSSARGSPGLRTG